MGLLITNASKAFLDLDGSCHIRLGEMKSLSWRWRTTESIMTCSNAAATIAADGEMENGLVRVGIVRAARIPQGGFKPSRVGPCGRETHGAILRQAQECCPYSMLPALSVLAAVGTLLGQLRYTPTSTSRRP